MGACALQELFQETSEFLKGPAIVRHFEFQLERQKVSVDSEHGNWSNTNYIQLQATIFNNLVIGETTAALWPTAY